MQLPLHGSQLTGNGSFKRCRQSLPLREAQERAYLMRRATTDLWDDSAVSVPFSLERRAYTAILLMTARWSVFGIEKPLVSQ